MTYRRLPDNLPDLLGKAGLKVVEIDGWRTRGRPASTGEFKPVGSLNHHDARKDVIGDAADDLAWAKHMFITGRPDLPAPLCQLALSMEGVVYVGASGRANHAGVARPSGSVSGGDGNALYVGTEWMLSGSQGIPKVMYEAGVKLNGVLMDVLGNSVQTISCHFNTSVTGKWDIGDPNGVPFNGHRVLNVPKLRDDVKKWRASRNPTPPESEFLTVHALHASLQYSDTAAQMRQDIGDLFNRAKDRGVWFLTGTEAGPGADPTEALLREHGERTGFRVFKPKQPTDCWIAVARERIDGGWTKDYEVTIPGSSALYKALGKDPDANPRWGPKGVVSVGFDNDDVGRMNVGAAHYLTKGRSPKGQPINGIDHYHWNEELADAIGDWARKVGKGSALAFYGGDQNISDRLDDTFFGNPLTSLQDELKKWENTGHGPIDVLASFDHDGRVEGKYIRVLDDSEFFQHSDHFVVEGGWKVRRLAK